MKKRLAAALLLIIVLLLLMPCAALGAGKAGGVGGGGGSSSPKYRYSRAIDFPDEYNGSLYDTGFVFNPAHDHAIIYYGLGMDVEGYADYLCGEFGFELSSSSIYSSSSEFRFYHPDYEGCRLTLSFERGNLRSNNPLQQCSTLTVQVDDPFTLVDR